MNAKHQKKATPSPALAHKSAFGSVFESIVNLQMHGRFEAEAEYAARKRDHPEQFHNKYAGINRIQQGFLKTKEIIKSTLLGIEHTHESSINTNKLSTGEMFFPIKQKSPQGYKSGGRQFGEKRNEGSRKHAGCDLLAPKGTPVYAMADGIVTLDVCWFWEGTYHLEIKHDNGLLIAYREIASTPVEGVKKGSKVKAGQLIAYLTPNTYNKCCMLHLEIFGDTVADHTLQKSGIYRRRSDLTNPNSYHNSYKMTNKIYNTL